MHRRLDPVALLAQMRAAQEELGERVDRRGSKSAAPLPAPPSAPDAAAFAKALGKTAEAGEPRATHRRLKRRYKTRVRMSMLDPHVDMIEDWLAAEPQLTALAIVSRLSERHPHQFGKKQHSIVQRLLKALRKKAAEKLVAEATVTAPSPGPVDGSGYMGPTRPQTLSPCSRSISQTTADRHPRITFSGEAIRGVNFARRLTRHGTSRSRGAGKHDGQGLRARDRDVQPVDAEQEFDVAR